jgi:hypothetical protein
MAADGSTQAVKSTMRCENWALEVFMQQSITQQ